MQHQRDISSLFMKMLGWSNELSWKKSVWCFQHSSLSKTSSLQCLATFPWFCSVSLQANTKISRTGTETEQFCVCCWKCSNCLVHWGHTCFSHACDIIQTLLHVSVRNIGRWKVWMSSLLAGISIRSYKAVC